MFGVLSPAGLKAGNSFCNGPTAAGPKNAMLAMSPRRSLSRRGNPSVGAIAGQTPSNTPSQACRTLLPEYEEAFYARQ